MSHKVKVRFSWGSLSSLGWLVMLMLLLALFLAAPKSAYAQEDGVDAETEAAITAVLEAVTTAFVDADVETIDALTAQGFMQIDADGMVTDRDGWLALAEQIDFVDLSVREGTLRTLAPGAVLATLILDIKAMDGEFEWEGSELETITFVQEDGEWKMASLHASYVPTEAEMLQHRIDLALSGAPPSVAAGATVAELALDGSTTVLQEGDNGFVCFPDDPTTLGDDPTCLDEEWRRYYDAFFAGEEPDVQGPGIAYMLQGGYTASNSDPSATEPPEGEEYLYDGPHMMIILPGGFDAEVFTTEHGSGLPYIMWDDTPYEHLMVPIDDPVTEEGMDEMQDMEE